MPAEDASAVAWLRRAGAIVLGKTSVRAENPVHGRTSNPYNLDYSPTGSSSGEAAIIAAGGSPLGLGSDLGRQHPPAGPRLRDRRARRPPAACR